MTHRLGARRDVNNGQPTHVAYALPSVGVAATVVASIPNINNGRFRFGRIFLSRRNLIEFDGLRFRGASREKHRRYDHQEICFQPIHFRFTFLRAWLPLSYSVMMSGALFANEPQFGIN